MLILEGLVGLHRTLQLQLLQYCWSGNRLDYCDIEWFALETNRDHSVIFETASKYCILDSFVDYHGYSISSKGLVVESSDKLWSTGEGNGKPLQYSCNDNPMNSMKRQKDRTLKDVLPRSVAVQYATGNQWRNNSRKNEEMEPKEKQYLAVDVTGDESKVRCYKEQYCI